MSNEKSDVIQEKKVEVEVPLLGNEVEGDIVSTAEVEVCIVPTT